MEVKWKSQRPEKKENIYSRKTKEILAENKRLGQQQWGLSIALHPYFPTTPSQRRILDLGMNSENVIIFFLPAKGK